MTKRYAVGSDIGGSHICSCVVDLEHGAFIGKPVNTDIEHTLSAWEITAAWEKNLREVIGAAGVEIVGVGMAFPGPFDYKLGISHMDHKFPALKGINIGDTLRSRLPEYPGLEFRFINDANAFALGESLYGAGKDMEKGVAMTLGTGLGSGFVDKGRIVESGPSVPPDGEVWNLPYGSGIADEAFSTRGITGRYKALTGKEVSGALDVRKLYDTDESARKVFESFGRELAEFSAPILKKFGSDSLLLGGNISRSLDVFIGPMQEKFAEEGMDIKIKASILLDKAAMAGAAATFTI